MMFGRLRGLAAAAMAGVSALFRAETTAPVPATLAANAFDGMADRPMGPGRAERRQKAPRHTSARYVAQDKRDAAKRRSKRK